jgi:hypothetical protein
MLAARRAGQTPKATPTRPEIEKAMTGDQKVMMVFRQGRLMRL